MLSWIFVYIHIFMYISQIGKEGTAQRGRFRCQWRQEPISYQLWFAREETYVSDKGGPMTHDRWSRLLTLLSVAEARKLRIGEATDIFSRGTTSGILQRDDI